MADWFPNRPFEKLLAVELVLLGRVLLLFSVFLRARFADLAFFLGRNTAAMRAFLAFGFGLFATRRKLLVLFFGVFVVSAKSGAGQKG
jgi:hypothetical protein